LYFFFVWVVSPFSFFLSLCVKTMGYIAIELGFRNWMWLFNFGRRLCELSVVYEWMRIFLFEFDLPLIAWFFFFLCSDLFMNFLILFLFVW
jgi:hypothetical protein